MSYILQQANELSKELIGSKEYLNYKDVKEKLQQDTMLYNKVNEFRRRNFELQNRDGDMNLFDEVDGLQNEYSDILSMPIVSNFLSSEQEIFKLIQTINFTILKDLDLDMNFLN